MIKIRVQFKSYNCNLQLDLNFQLHDLRISYLEWLKILHDKMYLPLKESEFYEIIETFKEKDVYKANSFSIELLEYY